MRLGTTLPEAQWIPLSYLVAVCGSLLAAGRLGDRLGRRPVLMAGVLVFTLASAGCAAAPSLGWMLAARAAQGAGAATMMALTVALVGEVVAGPRLGRTMGLLGSMSAVGTSLGPSLGGLLVSAWGWPAVFLVNVPLGVLTLVLARALPAGRRPVAPRTRKASISTAAPGLVACALVAAVLMATLVVGPFHLSALGLDAVHVGLVMSVGPIVAALAGVPAGRLTDRFGARRTSRWGLAAVGAGCVLLAAAPATLPGYVAPLVVLTAGYALFQTGNVTGVMQGVAAVERGGASALLGLSRHVGLAGGTLVLGAVFAAAGLRVTFGVAAVAVALAAAAGQGRRPRWILAS